MEGHRLVKEKFLENIKEFLSEQQEADMQEKEKQNVFPEEVIAEAEILVLAVWKNCKIKLNMECQQKTMIHQS